MMMITEKSCMSPFQRACLLAARAPHSGDWLLVLPITACGLRLEDEAVRIAVTLTLNSGVHTLAAVAVWLRPQVSTA